MVKSEKVDFKDWSVLWTQTNPSFTTENGGMGLPHGRHNTRTGVSPTEAADPGSPEDHLQGDQARR